MSGSMTSDFKDFLRISWISLRLSESSVSYLCLIKCLRRLCYVGRYPILSDLFSDYCNSRLFFCSCAKVGFGVRSPV